MTRDAAIAAVIRCMKREGVTRAELGRRAGMSRASVSHVLNASDNRTDGNVTSDTIDRMLHVLGYEAVALTTRTTRRV